MSHAHTALSLVTGPRNESYGTPKPDFERIALVWSGLIGEKLMAPITAVEVGLLMTGLKLVRHAHKPKDDNLVDAHGYLACVEWIETGAKPNDPQIEILEQRLAMAHATIEDVCCGTRLQCDNCGKSLPCMCEHGKP